MVNGRYRHCGRAKAAQRLGRYLIGVPQSLSVGTNYTLSIQAPWIGEDKRLAAYLLPEHSVASDLNLQLVYPLHAGWAVLQRIDYLLRSAAPGWPRGTASACCTCVRRY